VALLISLKEMTAGGLVAMISQHLVNNGFAMELQKVAN